jgi:hypothetical protein
MIPNAGLPAHQAIQQNKPAELSPALSYAGDGERGLEDK